MSNQIQIAGADLFRLALLYYGDATQWYRIAAANQLFDPLVAGPVTLSIPVPSPRPTNGGILGGN